MASKHYLQDELETQISTNPETWAFLQRGSLDGCWYWDLENPDQEWMSPEFWRLFGVDPATKQHDPAEWQDLMFAEDRKLALANFERHLADPEHPYDQIVRYRHADGSTVWVRCRGIAIRDAEGKPVRMLGAHNDLTAAKNAEARARREIRAAESANEELRTFSYSVSHDMKGPLSTLRALFNEIDTTQAKRMDDAGRELLGLGRQTLDRMQFMLESVLQYTRVIGEPDALAPVPLGPIVDSAVRELAADIARTGASVNREELPAVLGDSTSLHTLFCNLIANAITYRRHSVRPEICISAQADDTPGRMLIQVRDNGIGIAPADQQGIFDVFRRLHVHRDYPGNGMGLAICRRIALNHGGHIVLHSTPGKGSSFAVSLGLV